MSTLTEICYDILGTIEGDPRFSDDSSLSLENLYFRAHATRAQLIRQDLNKGRSVSGNITQTLACVPVVLVSASECCNLPTTCKVMRTENEIPAPIESAQEDLFFKISGVETFSPSWNNVDYARMEWYGSNKSTKNSVKTFYKDRYMYIFNPPMGLKYIKITGVFENPAEVSSFLCGEAKCWSADMKYPISNHMINPLKALIIKDLMQGKQFADQTGDELDSMTGKIKQ